MGLPARYARVTMNIQLESHIAQNVYWFKPTAAPPTTFDTGAAATAAYAKLKPIYMTYMASKVKLLGADLHVTYDGLSYSGSNYATDISENDPDALPDECAVIASLKTAFPGRSGYGRVYLPGIVESQTDESHINEFARAAIEDKVNDLLLGNTWGGVSFTFSVYSPKLGALHDVVRTPVESVICHQRRRRPAR